MVAGGWVDGGRDGGTPPAVAAVARVVERAAMGGPEMGVGGETIVGDGCCCCCCCCCITHLLNGIAMGVPAFSRISNASCNTAACLWLEGDSMLSGKETLPSCSMSMLISACSKSNKTGACSTAQMSFKWQKFLYSNNAFLIDALSRPEWLLHASEEEA